MPGEECCQSPPHRVHFGCFRKHFRCKVSSRNSTSQDALRQLGHPHLFQEELQALSRRSRYAWTTVRGSMSHLSTEADARTCISDLVARYGRLWQSRLAIAINISFETTENQLTKRRGHFKQPFVVSMWGANRVACVARQVGAVLCAVLK